ncbi:squalene/phytoene synthase family protein [Yoonia sediminilitoris]|uniref:Squalene/phytoene synthase n=1 Tax=Yoonia sediminilitoris TaxID=1286148 RepID=A0A2T6KRZ2_9RHOB|nr:squalene/phytoene synthase family protein [Yoonia sediminilitoris]PUB19331.1 squalene/phytoene synthase [Yoonia sediminilitoris]RCW99499.1 squalene/phytoene synthase [Yoonia sediminilitoris]
MTLNACAALVEKADHERFRSIMASPVAARPVLFALFAFNIEVARAPWVTQEPMIAEMRLQWWRDALEEIAEGRTVRRHDVVDVLAQVLDPDAARLLDGLVAARRWDIYTDAFEDDAHLENYLDATCGHLVWTAARLLGKADEDAVRHAAYGIAVANLLRAIPELEARGRKPLLDGTPKGVQALAQQGLSRFEQGTRSRALISQPSGAALLVGHMARPVLQRAVKAPGRVAGGDLEFGPIRQSARLFQLSVRGWWR